jgi:eukaryotic-like serine/threonine-protein kinase
MTSDVRDEVQRSLGAAYSLERELGSAGMSRVFVAGDTALGRKVVMKVLHPDLAEGLSAERFKREIQLAARLQHPHIVPLLSAGALPSGLLYYTMPFVDGESLRERIAREGPLPIAAVIAILRDVASALACAHRQHIVHRDIKPDNVLLSEGGAVVTDFGIAKAIRAALEPELDAEPRTTTITRHGMSLGTPAYMAPEQAVGDAVDARTDLYALGLLGYEMLAGRQPFEGRTVQQQLAAHAAEAPPPVASRRATTPPALSALVMQLLEKTPADRPQSADDVLRTLESVRISDISDSAVPARVGRTRATQSRYSGVALALLSDTRVPWTLAGLGIVTALLLGVDVVRRRGTSERLIVASIAAPPAQELQPANNVAFSPDGARIAFVAADAQGRASIWVRALDSARAIRLERTDGASWPFWSPDGRAIGFFATGQLKTIDVRGGAPRVLCPIASPSGGAWTKEDIIVYSPALFGPLYRVQASGGPCTQLTRLRPGDFDHRRPSALPDGRVLFSGFRINAALAADMRTGEITEVRRPGRDVQFAPPDLMVFRDEDNGPLYVQRLDLATLKPIGEARILVDRVSTITQAFARFSVTSSSLVYEAPPPLGSLRLLWLDRRSIVVDSVVVPGDAFTFGLSRDGRRIAFGGWGMWQYDRSRSVATPLSVQSTPAQATLDPAWGPGDSLIAYRPAYAGTLMLRLYHVPSGRSDSLFFPGRRAPFRPNWSPDGRRIAFSLRSGEIGIQEDIWIYSLDDRQARRAWEPKGSQQAPVWSPDGKWLAYHSDQTGAYEVWIRQVDGGGAETRVSSAGGQFPQWRADGGALFYRAPDNSIMEVDVTRGASLELSTPRLAVVGAPFSPANRAFAVTPDGNRFIALSRGDPPVFNLVLDWQSRLRIR